MQNKQELINTWNKLASLYEERFMSLDIYDKTYDLLCGLLDKKGALVLEIGCGPGIISDYLIKKRPDLIIDATDIAGEMIALAARNNPRVNYFQLDGCEIETLQKKYDAIVCGFLLPYLSSVQMRELLFSCARVLNPCGLLYLSFVPGDPAMSAFQESEGLRLYFNYHTAHDVIHTLKAAGFSSQQPLTVNYDSKTGKKETHTVIISRLTGLK